MSCLIVNECYFIVLGLKQKKFGKTKKDERLTLPVPNGSNFSKPIDKCVHTWYTFLTNVVLHIL